MRINERIKNIRKTLDLNQSDFAKKLGIGQAAISALEKGIRSITDQTILLLCSTYNVNEDYLRNGTSPMFNQDETFSLDKYAKEHNASDIDIEILKIYLNLDKDVRRKIISDFKKIFIKNESNELLATSKPTLQEETEEEILPEYEAMSTDEITKQMAMLGNILEKRQAEESLTSLPQKNDYGKMA